MIPERIFINILNMSLTGSLMILAVLLMRLFLKRAPKIFSYMLWLIVLFRLLCPISFESEFSLLNMLGVSSVGNGTVDFISESIGTEGSSEMKSLFGNLNMSSESADTDDEIRAALQEENTYGNNRYGYAGQGGTTSEDGRRQGIQSETTNPNIIQQETEPGEAMQDESGNSESMQQDAAGQAAAYEDADRQGNMQQIDAQKSSDTDNIESLRIWGILGSLYSSQLQSVFSVGSVIWIIGVGALLLYGFGSYLHLNRKLYRLESNELEPKEPDSKGIELNDPATDDISAVKNRTRIYRCNDIPTAFVLGLFRSRIYLPANLDETEERYILLHEQVHIKRGDSLYRTIAYLALCLHWFNPLAWLAFHLSGMDMEMSCDEAVIRQIGSGIKKEYSQTLLAMATGSSMVKGIPLAFGEGDTGSRIKNVLGYKKPTVIIVAVVLVLSLGASVFLLGNPLNKTTEDNGEVQVSEDDAADETDLSEGESNDNSAGNSNNLTNEQQGTEEYSNSIAWSVHSILDIENDQKVIFRTDDNIWITDVTASNDTVYAILSDSKSYRGHHWVVAIDREKSIDTETQEEYYPVRSVDELECAGSDTISMSDMGLGYYNNTLYIQYTVGQLGRGLSDTYYYSYVRQGDGSYLKTQDDFCKLIDETEYRFETNFSEFMNCLGENDVLLFQSYHPYTLYCCDVSGNLIWEHTVGEDLSPLMTGEQILLRARQDYTYYVYNWKEGENGSLKQVSYDGYDYIFGSDYIFKVSGDYVYYYKMESQRYKFYRVGIDTGEESLLFEIETVPGQPGLTMYHSDFNIWNDCIYFVNYDEGELWWFSCDLSDENYTITRLDVAEDYKGIFDMASVDSEEESYYCSLCGEMEFGYYIEVAQITDSSIPYTEEINETIKEVVYNLLENESRWTPYDNRITDPDLIEPDGSSHESHSEVYPKVYRILFEGMTEYVLESIEDNKQYNCLEVDYYHYFYCIGNDFSKSYRTRLLFDLSDGSLINLGDICSISEEEFRTLAAEYTLADFRNDDIRYYYNSDEEEIYSDAYNYAKFGCLMSLTSDGVKIIYRPETLGEEFIEVTIPYDELGLRLVEIYGVNE